MLSCLVVSERCQDSRVGGVVRKEEDVEPGRLREAAEKEGRVWLSGVGRNESES
jgi:hypothetical protein